MAGYRQDDGWSVKHGLLLPVLMHLDQIKPVGHVFRSIYRTSALVIAWLLRQPGVRNIYLRRGIAKNEFMPFLSDIDMLVITDSVPDKEKVEARLKRLRRLVPMLEPQSPVVTLAEFHGWQEPGIFADNRSFLYRVLEARATWETLYSRDNDNPLEKTRKLERNEIIAVIYSEILFWHRIVVTEYTSYHLGKHRPYGLAKRKRFCWIFMKATTELYNFLHSLQHRHDPLYTRRQAIGFAIDEMTGSRWAQLFESSLMMLDNQFDPRHSDSYLEEAFSHLSFVYGEFYKLMSMMLDEHAPFLVWLRDHCRRTGSGIAPDYHAVDLDSLSEVRIPDDENVAAICAARQPRSNPVFKVLLIFVLKSLSRASGESIGVAVDIIAIRLMATGINRDQIEVELVDQYGYRCFATARQTGPKVTIAKRGDGSFLLPSLYDRMFVAGLQGATVQTANIGAANPQ